VVRTVPAITHRQSRPRAVSAAAARTNRSSSSCVPASQPLRRARGPPPTGRVRHRRLHVQRRDVRTRFDDEGPIGGTRCRPSAANDIRGGDDRRQSRRRVLASREDVPPKRRGDRRERNDGNRMQTSSPYGEPEGAAVVGVDDLASACAPGAPASARRQDASTTGATAAAQRSPARNPSRAWQARPRVRNEQRGRRGGRVLVEVENLVLSPTPALVRIHLEYRAHRLVSLSDRVRPRPPRSTGVGVTPAVSCRPQPVSVIPARRPQLLSAARGPQPVLEPVAWAWRRE